MVLLVVAAMAPAFAAPAVPPIPSSVSQHATGFMEWVFEVQFTPEQQAKYRQILNATWTGSNQGAIDAVQSMANLHEKLPAMAEADRNTLRARMRAEFTKLLRSTSDADSQWLWSVLMPEPQQAASGVPPSLLLGRWTNGRISSIQYQNTITGTPAPTNGTSFGWEFRADGTYSFTGLMQSVIYNCTTTMFSNETGRYQVQGDTVSLKPEKNPYKMTNNCAPNSNREAPGKLIERSYRFRVAPDGNGPAKLELVGGDGATQTFARSR